MFYSEGWGGGGGGGGGGASTPLLPRAFTTWSSQNGRNNCCLCFLNRLTASIYLRRGYT